MQRNATQRVIDDGPAVNDGTRWESGGLSPVLGLQVGGFVPANAFWWVESSRLNGI